MLAWYCFLNRFIFWSFFNSFHMEIPYAKPNQNSIDVFVSRERTITKKKEKIMRIKRRICDTIKPTKFNWVFCMPCLLIVFRNDSLLLVCSFVLVLMLMFNKYSVDVVCLCHVFLSFLLPFHNFHRYKAIQFTQLPLLINYFDHCWNCLAALSSYAQ